MHRRDRDMRSVISRFAREFPETNMLDANSATSGVMSSSGRSWTTTRRSCAAAGSPAPASSMTSCEI